MKRSKHTLTLAFASLCAMLAILAGCSGTSDENSAADSARHVTLQTMEGETINLADVEGKPILLNFWATWCAPCRVEMPILQAYYDQHQADFVFYAVNMSDSAEAAQAYIEQGGYTFPVALDPDSLLGDQLAVRGLPVSLIYDADGTLRYRHTGALTQDVLDEQLTPLLEQ